MDYQTEIAGHGGLLATAVSVIAAILFLRKRFFQDGAEIVKSQSEAAKSQAEVTLVATLIDQAETYKEDARVAWSQRTRDAERIARQEAQIRSLYRTIRIMQSILKEVAPEQARLFDDLNHGDELDSELPHPTFEGHSP